MPGRPTKPPTSQRQARFYFAEAERGVPWAEEKVAKIHQLGPGSVKRLPVKRVKATQPSLGDQIRSHFTKSGRLRGNR